MKMRDVVGDNIGIRMLCVEDVNQRSRLSSEPKEDSRW